MRPDYDQMRFYPMKHIGSGENRQDIIILGRIRWELLRSNEIEFNLIRSDEIRSDNMRLDQIDQMITDEIKWDLMR